MNDIELDALMAELMGYERRGVTGSGYPSEERGLPVFYAPTRGEFVPGRSWRPSTDISDAWEVVEKMATLKPNPWMLELKNWNYYGERDYTAKFTTHPLGPEPYGARDVSAAKAICLAALKALGAETPR